MFLLSDAAGSMAFYQKNGIYLSVLCKQYFSEWNAGVYTMALGTEEKTGCSDFSGVRFFSVSDVFPGNFRNSGQCHSHYALSAMV